MRILENQDKEDFFIYNGDDDNIPFGLMSNSIKIIPFSIEKYLSNGSYLDEDMIMYSENGSFNEICKVDELSLRGEHNIQNSLAVINIAMNLGIGVDKLKYSLKEKLLHKLLTQQEWL